MDYLLAAGGVLQIYLTGKKIRAGWLIGLATSAIWVVYAFTSEQYGFIFSAIIFASIHYKNWKAWKTSTPNRSKS